jgi:hypothetical protein
MDAERRRPDDRTGEEMGHGVIFAAPPDAESKPWPPKMVAVIRGFQWRHAGSEAVYIEVQPPGGELGDQFLTDARLAIEHYIVGSGSEGLGPGPISPTLTAIFNA